MEKRILKKSISLVLALCMLISLLPAISFAAEPITFYFGDVASCAGSVADLKTPDGIDYIEGESTDKAHDRIFRVSQGTTDGLIQIYDRKKNWFDGTNKNHGQVVFTADLGENPAAGWYQIQFTGGAVYYASDLYIYANDTYVGEYIPDRTSSDRGEVGSTKTYGAVYLQPDADGKVKFKVAAGKLSPKLENGAAGTYQYAVIYLSSLSLTYLGAKDEYGYKISHTLPETLSLSELLGKEFSAYLDAGDGIARAMNGINSDKSANADNISVAIEEGESLTVSSTETGGIASVKLVPVKTGATKLKITASLGGETYEAYHTVNVVEATEPPKPIKVAVDFTESELPTESAATLSALGQYSAVAEETGTGGKSYISLVTMDSETALQIPHNKNGVLWLDAVDVAQRKDTQFTIKVPLAAPGYYTFDISGFKYADQGSEYYVYADDKYAGYVSFNGVDEKEVFTNRLNTLYLEPDEDNTVKIMFATAAHSVASDKNMLYLKSLTLTPVEDPEKVEFDKFTSTLPEKIYVGTPVDFTAKAVMNDGSTRRINGYTSVAVADAGNYITASVKSGDAAIAKTSDDKFSDGVYSGTLTATQAGDITVAFSVKLDGGEAITREVSVKAEIPPKLSSVEVVIDKASIPVTRTAKASLTLTRDDGSPLPENEERTVEYTAAPEGVVTVAQDGTVTAVGVGTATITATVKTSDVPQGVSGSAEINVTAAPTLESISLSADSNTMVPGQEKKLSATAVMSDSLPGDISKYPLTFTSSDDAVATVSADGTVTAHKEGTALITATATGEIGSVAASVAVTVYDGIPTTVIDFTQTVTASANDGWPFTGESPGYTVTNIAGDHFRKYTYPDSGRNILHIRTGNQKNAWPGKEIGKNTFAIKVNIPFESDYSVVLSGGKWYAGSVYSVFIDGVYAGDYDFWDGTHYEEGKTMPAFYTGDARTLNTLHLTAGDHEVSFRMRESDYPTSAILLDTLKFIPVEGKTVFEKIESSLPDELAVGEIFASDATAVMSDGSAYHFGLTNAGALDTENTFTAKLTGDGATLSDFAAYAIGKSGKSSFTLTGVSENLGGVTVSLSAKIGDIEKEISKTIPIRNDKIASTTAHPETGEVFAGDMSYLIPTVTLASGRVINSSAVVTTYKSLTENVVTVDEETGLVTALKVGTARVLVTSSFNGDSVSNEIEFEILPEGMTDVLVTAGGSEKIRLTDIENDTVPLYVQAISNLGNKVDMTGAEVSAEIIAGSDFAEFAEGFDILPKAVGDVTFRVRVKTANGRIREVEKTLAVVKGKSKASYMTAEKAAAARENVKKYDWAKKTVQSYIDTAEKYVDKLDLLYDMITSNGVPRGYSIGGESDPDMYFCRYCNTDISIKHGMYAWQHDALSRPWQVQCPECKRLFPSNDFGSFYKLGLNEYGEFDRIRALENHRAMLIEKGLIDTTVTEPGKEHSKQWKAYYGYGVEGGYLYNELYDKVATEKTINAGKGLREGETVETWGVDDSMGYVPALDDGTPYTYDNGVVERHTYIAEYLHSGVWRSMAGGTGGDLFKAMTKSAYAYFYTGDVRYGRVAAILIDRLADFYPDYDISIYGNNVWNSDGGSNLGKTIGRIWETGNANEFAMAYDMVYDMYDDPYVMDYIKNKNKIYKTHHAKETPSQVRTNIEDGLLRTILEGLKDTSIAGNFGYPQLSNAYAAVVLDTMPETGHWLDFLMAAGWTTAAPCLGGGIDEALLNTVDADGQGNESSKYNSSWHKRITDVNDIINGYTGYSVANLYNNPKFVQMFYSNIPLISSGYTPEIGDSSSTQGREHWMKTEDAMAGWTTFREPLFAQLLYLLNGNKAEGLHYDITAEDPERLEKEVEEVIEEYGEFIPASDVMTNFGFAALRSGADYSSAVGSTAVNTSRDVWMYFGSIGASHGHKDTMNLGMTAFGLNFMPDLGYPEATGKQPNRLQWVASTLSHNTVMVDEKEQEENEEIRGKIKHFDGDGTVQVMDVSAPYAYKSTDEYRRSVVYVKTDDENSYAVDFFRVLGGDSHLYSFHAASNNIKNHNGLDFTLVEDENGNYISGSQLDDNGEYKGTYVGRDVTYIKKTTKDGTVTVRLPVEGEKLASNEVELPLVYGEDPNSPNSWEYETLFPRGYTWLRNIDRDAEPENKVEVDFEIKDFNKAIKGSKDLGLYMTVLNDSNVKNGANAEISIADGLPPQKVENKNIDKLKYVLIKNEGKDLDTTFTTVFEPYKGSRYISSADELAMNAISGTPADSDAARAVKVTHKSGRVDYIFYATNNAVTYEINDNGNVLSFRGFVGVYTLQNGTNTYRYVLDGDIIGEATEKASVIEGTVKTFTKTHEEKNEIVITAAPGTTVTEADVKSLSGKVLIIDNGAETRSGTFKIENATLSGSDITVDIGRITPIRKYVDAFNPGKGYVYMISEGQNARIPLEFSEDGAPEFDAVSDGLTVSAGSSIKVAISASSPVENVAIAGYEGETLPRGASINAATGEFTWKPDSSQVGENHVAITARDEYGRESTIHFTITVYGSTTGSSSKDDNEEADSSGSTGETTTPSGGGGGGGGGDAPTPDNSGATEEDNNQTDNGGESGEPGGNTDNTGTEDGTLRFTDLGNHAWAEDAINTLAMDGIIKGTSASTFSPAANITRADFAILLVRAFDLKSDNTENFADVSASDYFASELAIARNNGIISGIGDNKYAPRNHITRQDMIVIVYRALQTRGVGFGIYEEPQYEDFTTVAPYARDAVSALIGAGLVNGKSGRIAPADYTTRAEVAVMIKRILDYTK